MSKEAVQVLIGKAVLDGEFRQLLFSAPEQAVAGYDLTEEELSALKAIDEENLVAFAGALDERISKVMAPGPSMGQMGRGAVHSWDPETGMPFSEFQLG